MQIVYAQESFPEAWEKSIFLAGPSPRDGVPATSWRTEAIKLLSEAGYEGVVFSPEPEKGSQVNYDNQIEWERTALQAADCVLFWVPRDLETLPGFTTNVEFGQLANSGKVVFGAPPNAPKVRYLEWVLKADSLGLETRQNTLKDTIDRALLMVSKGALRTGGERFVPLQIWNLPAFKNWYDTLIENGNRLDGAKVLWTFRPHNYPKSLFAFSLWVNVWIASEERHKDNEFVISRPDISTAVLTGAKQEDFLDTKILLVKEFRSPARTSDGFIHELAGGSSFKPGKDPLQIASDEIYEETGLVINPSRLRPLGIRQVGGTLSSFSAFVVSAEMTSDEVAQAEKVAAAETTFGVIEDTERTFVEVVTLREAFQERKLDWATLGMLFESFFKK